MYKFFFPWHSGGFFFIFFLGNFVVLLHFEMGGIVVAERT